MTLTRTCACAWAICVASTVASAFCYRALTIIQKTNQEIVKELPRGESAYGIGDAAACVGALRVTVSEEQREVSVKGSGLLRAALGGARGAVTLDVQADFNALNQLGGAFLRLSGDNGSVTLSLLNVHPIIAAVKVRTAALHKELSVEIPGPIVIERSASGYHIRGAASQKMPEQARALLQQPLLKKFSLFAAQSSDALARCKNKDGAVWELDPLVQLLQSIGAILPEGMRL